MSCEIVETEQAIFVVWGKPLIMDVERVLERVRLRAETAKSPIFYVTRVPTEAPAPESDVRRHLNRRLPSIVESCASYHVILEGDGFSAAMKRGVLLSLFQLTNKRGMFSVHATVAAFRSKVPPSWRLEINRLLERAAQDDLLEGAIPCERVGSGSFLVGGKGAEKVG